MVFRGPIDAGKLSDGRIPKPGELVERQIVLATVDEKPQPVLGHVRKLNPDLRLPFLSRDVPGC